MDASQCVLVGAVIRAGRSHRLVPGGVAKGNHVAKRLEGLVLGHQVGGLGRDGGRLSLGLGLGSLGGGSRGGFGLFLGLGVERADLQLGLVLLQDALVVVLWPWSMRLIGGVAKKYELSRTAWTHPCRQLSVELAFTCQKGVGVVGRGIGRPRERHTLLSTCS